MVTKFVKSPPLWRLSSANSVLDAATAGFRYCQAACASLPLPAYWEAVPWIRFWSPFRVGGLSVLNSWSMSTALVVSVVGMTPSSAIFGALDGPSRRST